MKDRSGAFNDIGGSGSIGGAGSAITVIVVQEGGVHDSIESGVTDKGPSVTP